MCKFTNYTFDALLDYDEYDEDFNMQENLIHAFGFNNKNDCAYDIRGKFDPRQQNWSEFGEYNDLTYVTFILKEVEKKMRKGIWLKPRC